MTNEILERKYDVREVAHVLEVTPDSIYSFFKTRKIRLRKKDENPGLTYDQLLYVIDSRLNGKLGAKQTPLSKTEMRDIRYIVNQRQDTLGMQYQQSFEEV